MYVRQQYTSNKAQAFHSHDCILYIRFVVYFHRNAVRTDAGEDRTVLYAVPLRGGAMQRHICAYSFLHKIFPLDIERRDTAVFQTGTVVKPHSFSHVALIKN